MSCLDDELPLLAVESDLVEPKRVPHELILLRMGASSPNGWFKMGFVATRDARTSVSGTIAGESSERWSRGLRESSTDRLSSELSESVFCIPPGTPLRAAEEEVADPGVRMEVRLSLSWLN